MTSRYHSYFRACFVVLPIICLWGCKSAGGVEEVDGEAGKKLLETAFAKYMAAKSFHTKSKVSVSADEKVVFSMDRTYDVSSPKQISIRFGELVSPSLGNSPATFVVANESEMIEGTSKEGYRYPAPPNIVSVGASRLLSTSWPHGSLIIPMFAGVDGVAAITDSTPMIDGHVTINGVSCTNVKFKSKGPWGTTTFAIDEKSGTVQRVSAKLEPLAPQLPPKFAGAKALLFQEDLADQSFDGPVPANVFRTDNIAQHVLPGVTPEGWLKEGDLAPNFELTRPDGSVVKSDSLRGKVVYIDFWATWCGPCKATLPNTQALYERLKNNPEIQVFAVSDEKLEVSTKFAEENHYTFPVALDKGQMAQRAFGVRAIPTFVVIDRSGHIAKLIYGSYEGMEKDIDATVEKLLAAK